MTFYGVATAQSALLACTHPLAQPGLDPVLISALSGRLRQRPPKPLWSVPPLLPPSLSTLPARRLFLLGGIRASMLTDDVANKKPSAH